jgi:hypothetical protein
MKLFVFVVHLLFWNLQKSSLVYRECGILQTVTHYGPQSADKAPYLPPGDMLSSSVGLNPGNLHQYPGDILVWKWFSKLFSHFKQIYYAMGMS